MMAEDEVNENEDGAATEGGEGEEDGEAKAGFNAKKLIIFIVLPLLLLCGVGGGLYVSGFLDPYLGGEECVEELDDHGEVITPCPEEEEAAHEEAAADHGGGGGGDHGGGHGEVGSGAFIAMPTMIVNLSEDDGSQRFLRLTVQLELENPAQAPEIEAVMPRVVDQFQTYLRELRVRDLRGSAGIYRLQMELLWRVNQAAAPVKVKDVLFQEILIQ